MDIIQHIQKISQELSLKIYQVEATARLLAEGGTVPFIARYRKEATGSIDEVAIARIRDRLAQLAELDTRRAAIIKSLEERQLLSDFLRDRLDKADTMTALEDIYLPYRPKRRTKATIAREKGLEPLAQFILDHQDSDPRPEAANYVNEEKGVASESEALAGARDIVAEWISDDADTRAAVRKLIADEAVLSSEVIPTKEEAGAKFRDYFEWSEPLKSIPSHRLLAIRRGEAEGYLFFRIDPSADKAVGIINDRFVTGNGMAAGEVRAAAKRSFKRLLGPSLETEARVLSKKKADVEAIRVFAENLRELLMASPLGQKRILAIDPGMRTGCKVVLLDAQGKLLHQDVIFIMQSQLLKQEAEQKILAYCARFQIEAIAVGNGTGSRETESFLRGLGLPASIPVIVVNESGASIYSASEVARNEFPDQDITVRGAVSIGRRLMDPLAELVKIDAKSIGVGQYQHDVDQNLLKSSLDDVVESCVNQVGVELNTASLQLLSYVAGLNNTIARNIVAHRDEQGPFKTREELKQVERLGPKAYEQAAGFLRISDGIHPLDASAVHPERYELVERIARDLNCSIHNLMQNGDLRGRVNLDRYVTDDVGMPTLLDILSELAKPGRDPRKRFEVFKFADGVESVEDLREGMKLPGIVTNVTAFGAFVDVGVHQDGLVHISEMADHFIKNPAEVVKVQQNVKVTVIEVDRARNRIALSMRSNPGSGSGRGGSGAGAGSSGNSRGDRSQQRSGGPGGRPGAHSQQRHEGRGGGRQGMKSINDDWFSQALKKGKK